MAEKKNRLIEWDEVAYQDFLDALEYISLDSFQGVKIVANAVFEATDMIPFNPEMHSIDDLKQNNDGTYRYLTVFSYRISYKIEPNMIIIVRFRHTSRNPLEY